MSTLKFAVIEYINSLQITWRESEKFQNIPRNKTRKFKWDEPVRERERENENSPITIKAKENLYITKN